MSNRLMKKNRKRKIRFPYGIDLDEAERRGLVRRTNCSCAPIGYLLVETGPGVKEWKSLG
jgi:hypothetical protein